MGPAEKSSSPLVGSRLITINLRSTGIHALNPLILVDEARRVPKSIFDAVDALATNSDARALAIGDPMILRRISRRSASRGWGGM
jgi:hypothetical protein